jgi:hypothetical protein
MTDDPRKCGADIEIYEETEPESRVTVAKYVRVNGTEMGLIARDGITVETGSGEEVRVTLVLQPRSVTIHQVRPEQTDKNSLSTEKATPCNPGLTTDPGPITINGHEAIKNAIQIRENAHHNHSHTDYGKE